MTDMPYLTVEQAESLGLEPSVSINGKVYSFYDEDDELQVHGHVGYEIALLRLKERNTLAQMVWERAS